MRPVHGTGVENGTQELEVMRLITLQHDVLVLMLAFGH